MGLTQVLVSDYERGRLRLSAEMAVRFAEALGISTDDLLRPRKKVAATPAQQPSLKLLRRMERIEGLPLYRQRALLTTIDQSSRLPIAEEAPAAETFSGSRRAVRPPLAAH
jgi:transcriptional regulator with XRE-family HTH domain